MRSRGTWALLGALLAVSGCAGMMGSEQAAEMLRVLSAASDAAPLSLEADPAGAAPADPPVAAWRITVEGPEQAAEAPVSADVEPDSPNGAADAPAPFDESQEEQPDDSAESPAAEPAFAALASDDPEVQQVAVFEPARTARQPALTPLEPRLAPEPLYDEQFLEGPLGEAEVIVTPGPVARSPFRAGERQRDDDRLSRQITDVTLDVRPVEGDLPLDLAAERYADEPVIDETWPSDMPPEVFCSYTPWTICFRPLYFEDIKLERYGDHVGCLQSGLSGVRFFGSIAALPYKMTVRPPRSCECSNGFSRCGDCPLPCYGQRQFRLDASLIEAAAVAGVVYILP